MGSEMCIRDRGNTEAPAGFSSPTRGIFAGGYVSPAASNVIQYLTIASTGNTTDFGDLTTIVITASACSSATRGVIGCIRTPGYTNNMEYVTMATLGNAIDFGDQTDNRGSGAPLSSPTRGCWAGGYGSPAYRNTIDYVEIATTGNAVDFGDINNAMDHVGGASNAHGGL